MAEITGAKLYQAPLNRGMMLGGFEAIYDCVGDRDSLSDGLRWARAGGTVVVTGISPKLMKADLSPLWHQEVNLIGSVVHGVEEWRGQRIHGYDLVIQWMRDGALPTDGLITHRFPLREFKNAVATAMDKRTGAIKVVLQM